MPNRPQSYKPYGNKPAQQIRADYEKRRRADPLLAQAAGFRDSTAWQKLRALVRETFPACCDPLGRGCAEPMAIGHHIEPLVERFDLRLTFTNVAPLCTSCNGAIEAMVRHGKPTRHLFAPHQARAVEVAQRSGLMATQDDCET